MEGFKLDLLPVSMGENIYHNPSTSKGMSFDQLLSAIRETRVKVRADMNRRSVREVKNHPLTVSHLMIREDVWQALSVNTHFKTLSSLYKKAIKLVKITKNVPKKGSPQYFDYVSAKYALKDLYYDNDIVAQYLTIEIPFTIGLADHWKLLLEKNLPMKKVKPVLNDIAEFIQVYKALEHLRYYWAPSNPVGTQYGEWDRHIDFFEKMLEIARHEKSVEGH